jgi:hypothetical protein
MFPHWAETGLGENLLKSERKETEVGTIPYPKEKLREEVAELLRRVEIRLAPDEDFEAVGELASVWVAPKGRRDDSSRCDVIVAIVPHALRADLDPRVEREAREGLEGLREHESPGVQAAVAVDLAYFDRPRWRPEDVAGLRFRVTPSSAPAIEGATDGTGQACFEKLRWDDTCVVECLGTTPAK